MKSCMVCHKAKPDKQMFYRAGKLGLCCDCRAVIRGEPTATCGVCGRLANGEGWMKVCPKCFQDSKDVPILRARLEELSLSIGRVLCVPPTTYFPDGSSLMTVFKSDIEAVFAALRDGGKEKKE